MTKFGASMRRARISAILAVAAAALTVAGCITVKCGFWNGQAAALVLGQGHFDTKLAGATASGMNAPTAVETDSKVLLVADSGNNRVLVYKHLPHSMDAPADVVIGQPDFTGTARNQGGALPAANTLSDPEGICWDGKHLFIADSLNGRVLVYNGIPTVNNARADRVIGEPNFTTSWFPTLPASAEYFGNVQDVKSDGTRLFVADKGYHRVLIYNHLPRFNDPADVVIGQPNMAGYLPNQNGPAPTASSMDSPKALALAGGRLFVADTANFRVLIYNIIPTVNGAAADVVVGQPDFTSRTSACGPASFSGMALGVFCDGTRLYVSSSGNRVLVYNSIPTANGVAAEEVLGQRDLFTCDLLSPTAPATNANMLPYRLAGIPGGVPLLYVADAGQNRVLEFRCLLGP